MTLPGVHSLHSGRPRSSRSHSSRTRAPRLAGPCSTASPLSPSTRRCAARRKGRLGVSTPSRHPPFTRLSPSRSQVRGTAFGLLGGTGRIASITARRLSTARSWRQAASGHSRSGRRGKGAGRDVSLCMSTMRNRERDPCAAGLVRGVWQRREAPCRLVQAQCSCRRGVTRDATSRREGLRHIESITSTHRRVFLP